MQRTEGKTPDDPNYAFKRLYQEVKKRGYIPYPGKLTEVDTFRVGCIGHFGEAGMPGAVAAIADTLKAMGVRRVSADAAT
ncbi:2-aminoethylphosphonate--pyruvate aminotransferase [Burkholderia sp. RF7-non_BP1]|nr:2-aminoethylphosphonate--pyruvate aminotransferase [Burkholderia sp. RF7-non_BP1]KUY91918.1 2-aminoethylphosphonate--pyruvate aminotransferase [Burkholderia sp. RF7-non_BP4]